MRLVLGLIACSFFVLGCVGSSSADQRSKADEFSEEGYEKAMIESGRQKELEEAKKREEAYLAAGRESGGDPNQQEGPTNAPTGATTGN